MSSATMTLIGLYQFAPYYDKDLFTNLSLPDELDKQTAIDTILLFCGENELLYPALDFNINLIGTWSTKWARTFQKWVDLFNLEYNPIENYDRIEAWSDSHSMSSSESHSLSSSESNSASASDSSFDSNSTKEDISAFNVSTYSPASASDGTNNAKAFSHSAGENKHGELSEDKHGELALDTHRGRVHGNIGVTTTQQMMQQEIDIQRFNIYEEIAIIFAREFTLAL